MKLFCYICVLVAGITVSSPAQETVTFTVRKTGSGTAPCKDTLLAGLWVLDFMNFGDDTTRIRPNSGLYYRFFCDSTMYSVVRNDTVYGEWSLQNDMGGLTRGQVVTVMFRSGRIFTMFLRQITADQAVFLKREDYSQRDQFFTYRKVQDKTLASGRE